MNSPVIKAAVILFALLFPVCASQAETVGVILTADVPYYTVMHEAFMSNLSRRGYLDRLKFIVQRPYADPVSWSNSVRKLIAADVDVILTYGSSATLAAIREKPGIPIVYAGMYEPVAAMSKSKYATGVSYKLPVSSILRYLRATTTIKTLGVLYCGMEEDSVFQLEEIKAMSINYGFTVTAMNLRKPADITAVLARSEIDALFLTSSVIVNIALPQILNIAKTRKIPTGSLLSCEDACAIITLRGDPKELGHKAADKMMEVLGGRSPGDIPAFSSQNNELIFNMKDAREMELRIPAELVTEATRIIYGEGK